MKIQIHRCLTLNPNSYQYEYIYIYTFSINKRICVLHSFIGFDIDIWKIWKNSMFVCTLFASFLSLIVLVRDYWSSTHWPSWWWYNYEKLFGQNHNQIIHTCWQTRMGMVMVSPAFPHCVTNKNIHSIVTFLLVVHLASGRDTEWRNKNIARWLIHCRSSWRDVAMCQSIHKFGYQTLTKCDNTNK